MPKKDCNNTINFSSDQGTPFYYWKASFYSEKNVDHSWCFYTPQVHSEVLLRQKSKPINQIFFLSLLQRFQNFAKPPALRWSPKIRQWFSGCCSGCKDMHCVITTRASDMPWSQCTQKFCDQGNQLVSYNRNCWQDYYDWKSCHMDAVIQEHLHLLFELASVHWWDSFDLKSCHMESVTNIILYLLIEALVRTLLLRAGNRTMR